jgi:hypothetical protein
MNLGRGGVRVTGQDFINADTYSGEEDLPIQQLSADGAR